MSTLLKKLALALALTLSPSFGQGDTLTAAVAASLQYVFDDLAAEFERSTGHELKPVYNSSGRLVSQVIHGAPFDVFLSADMDYPRMLHERSLTAGAPRVYAYGALVLWTRKDLNLNRWQEVLAGASVGTIALANPKTAPYGRETIKVLKHYGLDQKLTPKLVFGESIAQTNQYIHSGTADVGFTAKSVVTAPEMAGQGTWIELPRQSYTPIAQGALILKHGQKKNRHASEAFLNFMLSSKAGSILTRYGYMLP